MSQKRVLKSVKSPVNFRAFLADKSSCSLELESFESNEWVVMMETAALKFDQMPLRHCSVVLFSSLHQFQPSVAHFISVHSLHLALKPSEHVLKPWVRVQNIPSEVLCQKSQHLKVMLSFKNELRKCYR